MTRSKSIKMNEEWLRTITDQIGIAVGLAQNGDSFVGLDALGKIGKALREEIDRQCFSQHRPHGS